MQLWRFQDFVQNKSQAVVEVYHLTRRSDISDAKYNNTISYSHVNAAKIRKKFSGLWKIQKQKHASYCSVFQPEQGRGKGRCCQYQNASPKSSLWRNIKELLFNSKHFESFTFKCCDCLCFFPESVGHFYSFQQSSLNCCLTTGFMGILKMTNHSKQYLSLNCCR